MLIYALSLTILVIFVYKDIRGKESKIDWAKFWEEGDEEDEIEEEENEDKNHLK